jgi:PIN domain nuclease of toxin-antitoxin system
MNSAADMPVGLPSRQGSRAIAVELERLERQEADLASSLESALAVAHPDARSLARLLQARSSATREGITLVFHWMVQLDLRISRIESRMARLATRSADQQEALRMMCSVLKEMDDPYGLGLSLDERILGEAEHGPAEKMD